MRRAKKTSTKTTVWSEEFDNAIQHWISLHVPSKICFQDNSVIYELIATPWTRYADGECDGAGIEFKGRLTYRSANGVDGETCETCNKKLIENTADWLEDAFIDWSIQYLREHSVQME